MFRLSRYFSLTSFVAFLIVTILLGQLYHQAVLRELVELGEGKNVALTHAFANSQWPQFAPFILSAARLDAESLRNHPDTHKLRQAILVQMRNLGVVKVNIYAINGMTVFSTDQQQIGTMNADHPGFLAARSGQIVSELIQRDTLSTFDDVLEDRSLIFTYTPLRRGDQSSMIEGVFELYSDVTPLLQRIQRREQYVFAGILGILALLYLVLFVIVKRADLTMSRQSAELRKLSQAVEQSANTVVITDVQGNIEYVNPKFAETTGYTAEEVQGQNPRLLKSGQQTAEFYQQLWQTITSGGEWHGEFHNKRKDGSLYWEQATIAPIYNEQGRLTHFIGVKEDITERKRAEDALHESQRQLELVYYREQQRRQLSDTLREVGRIVSSTLDQEKVLELILAQLEHVITFHRATVSLLAGNMLTLVAGIDKLGGTIPPYSYIADEYPINAEVLHSQYPVLVPDVNRDERWRHTPTMQGIHSFICAPLVVKDQPIGILAVGSFGETPYTQEDAETVFAFATQVAIAVYNAQLHAEVRTRIERELFTAQQIQKSLLPHDIPEIPGLEIAGFSQPAREVGGDFYNVFVFDQQHVGIAVGDVSGKGMEAALMMALSFGLLTSEVRRAINPAALMNTLNRELRPHTKHNKMNTALGYLSLTSAYGTANGQWTLQAVNAGLIAPVVRHTDGTITWLDVAGLPLGAVRTPDYSESQDMLAPGDFIFLTTDGLVEAMNRDGEMYGFERLTRNIAAADCQSANSMLTCILQNLRHFISDAEVYDDWTIVVIKILSDSSSKTA